MVQPQRNTLPKKKKVVPKKVKPKDQRLPKPPKRTPLKRSERPHKEYGTSKLELRFAKNFLDALGIKYVYQFKAESIGRYYDFYLPEANILLEIDGDYFHGYGKIHEEKNSMQKHAEWVDKQKDMWALEHGIPIIRFWEHDINDNPAYVKKVLLERVGKYRAQYEKELEKKKRH